MNNDIYLLGIDLGTMGVKSTIYTATGKVVGSSYKEYPLDSPHPGWAQQDQSLWWKSTTSTIKECFKQAKISPEDVVAIGVCGQSHGPSAISKDGEPLLPCLTWVDRRSEPQVQRIADKVGARRVFEINGYPLDAAYTASKILWIKENAPDVYRNTYKFLLPKDFIVFKLTGVFSTDRTDAFATNLFDIKKNRWSEELLQEYDVPMDMLPEIHEPWEIVGEVSGTTAEEVGLNKGTPVAAGGGDWACTFYGAGFTKPGRGVDMTGTVDAIMVASDKFVLDFENGISGLTHIVPGLYSGAWGGTQHAGSILRWFRDELFCYEKNIAEKYNLSAYKLMDIEAEAAPPGSRGLLIPPNFGGQRRPENPNSRGLIYGLTLTTKRGEIIRAIMEGIAFKLRADLDRWKKITGVTCDEVRGIGGGARSKVWRQIKADILGVPFCRINIDEGGNLGAAILGGYAVGLYKDLIEPVETIVKVEEKENPIHENREIYNQLYTLYLKLHNTLEETKFYDVYMETVTDLYKRKK
ncbi:MAG: xylulokinase [Nitrososphaeria archaeon]